VAASAPTPGQGGTFGGEITTASAALTVPVGERAWTGRNDEADGVGASQLTLVTHPDGRVDGSVKGSLGELAVVGRAWEDSISATLVPVRPSPSAFGGTLFATRKGKALDGALYASRSDGSMIRTGAVKLTTP